MLDNQWFSTEISPMQNLVFGSLILIADPFGDRLLWVPVYELLFKPDSLVITKAIDLFKTRKIFMFVVYIKKLHNPYEYYFKDFFTSWDNNNLHPHIYRNCL